MVVGDVYVIVVESFCFLLAIVSAAFVRMKRQSTAINTFDVTSCLTHDPPTFHLFRVNSPPSTGLHTTPYADYRLRRHFLRWHMYGVPCHA